VYGCSAQLLPHDLRLPQVETDPHVESELLDGFDDGGSAPDGVPRVFEAGEEAVAGGVDLVSSESPQLASDHRVVARQKDPPPAIAELGHDLGGSNDVGEHECREKTLATGALHSNSIGEANRAGNGIKSLRSAAALLGDPAN
jgi:hypothetical protein